MLRLLSCDVGRGHPFYLDGLARECERLAPGRSMRESVFQISTGPALWSWIGVRACYALAGRSRGFCRFYDRVRSRSNHDSSSPALRVLGLDVRRWAQADDTIVVDHPVLAGILKDHPDVWVMHGEMVVPREACIASVSRMIVPTDEAAAAAVRGGLQPEQMLVTGLCIDHHLVATADEHAHARETRLARDAPLTVAFFSSGAEPSTHLKTMIRAARSGHPHRTVVVARRGGRFESGARKAGCTVVSYGHDLDLVTAELLGQVDVVVSPPHERSNWAMGLGIPFFLVGPDVGPFAPLNRRLLMSAGVALPLDDNESNRFGDWITMLRDSGELVAMARRGRGSPVDGFTRAAQGLIEHLESR